MYWFLKSTDPYNSIGKHALQDVYSWSTSGRIKHRIIYGRKQEFDAIRIDRA